MRQSRSIAEWMRAVLLAAMMALAPVGAARADGCNVDDLYQAAKETIGGIVSSSCAVANANDELWVAVLGISGVIAEMDSAPGDPGSQFCKSYQDFLQGGKTVAEWVKSIDDWCHCLSADTIKQLTDALSTTISAAADDLSIVLGRPATTASRRAPIPPRSSPPAAPVAIPSR